jgi:phenylpropionate dioxygenase-like ring-hydroxylating dioxygenase large terminal subunit
MIPNQWYPIAAADTLKPGKPLALRRLGEELVLWRDSNGRAICQTDRCPHKGARLSLGKVEGDRIQCPYHGLQYDAGGRCVKAPCLARNERIPGSLQVRAHTLRESSDLLWLWWGEERAELPPLPQIQEMDDDRIYSTLTWPRPVHYTRYIESLLEFYHITFVHRDHWFNYVDYLFLYGTWKKLGLDGKDRYLSATQVRDYECSVDGTTLRSRFLLVNEDDPSFPGEPYEITFAFPNLVYIKTSLFCAAAWLTPIDQDNTEMILRWYEYDQLRPVLRAPTVRKLLPWVSCYLEKWIQDRQDVRVMSSQRPKISAPGASRFMAFDEMNARYLSIRERLLREARAGQAEQGAVPLRAPAQDLSVEAS